MINFGKDTFETGGGILAYSIMGGSIDRSSYAFGPRQEVLARPPYLGGDNHPASFPSFARPPKIDL